MEVREAQSDTEIEAAMQLRVRVFVGEQGIDRVADQDGLDSSAVHVVAVEDGRVLGTCRLLRGGGVARLGRLAVDPAHRRLGLAAAILAESERIARGHGDRRIALNAQLYAERLYADAGYERVGAEFLEEGIEHVRMEREVA